MATRRKKNPEPITIIAALTAAGLGIWYFVHRDRKKKQKALATGELPSSGGGTGTAPKGGNYVGKPNSNWSWPHMDRYPNPQAFGELLNELGYGAAVGVPGWSLISAESMNTVKQFQRDFNIVRDALTSVYGITDVPKKLTVDGLVGPGTINAFVFAQDNYVGQEADSWIAVVEDSKTALANA